MSEIKLDFSKKLGKIKPMHAVNNGPNCTVGSFNGTWADHVRDSTQLKRNGNLLEYRDAGIPYARTHDASFYAKYGLEHTVDVHARFPNFDADPNDPASYDFTFTDILISALMKANCPPIFRLGETIENNHDIKAYRIFPPKDNAKWARICEHIVKHYNEGWADGYEYGIEYWEIWNEPDNGRDDTENQIEIDFQSKDTDAVPTEQPELPKRNINKYDAENPRKNSLKNSIRKIFLHFQKSVLYYRRA